MDMRHGILQKLQQCLFIFHREGAEKPQCFGERPFFLDPVGVLRLFGKLSLDVDSPLPDTLEHPQQLDAQKVSGISGESKHETRNNANAGTNQQGPYCRQPKILLPANWGGFHHQNIRLDSLLLFLCTLLRVSRFIGLISGS